MRNGLFEGILMKKVIIITDSTADVPKEILEKREIDVIPLFVNFDDESYKDGVDINLDQMFNLVEEKRALPKTSAASPGDFIRVFSKYKDAGYEIFYTGIGSKLSVAYQNACLARDELEGEIYCVDSNNLSAGIAILLYKACDLRDQGLSAKEIFEEITKTVPKVKSQFVIDTLEYLHKGGRCSGMINFFGTMLNIKPMIAVRDGKLIVASKTIGSMKKAIKNMMKGFYMDLKDNNVDLDYIICCHTYQDKGAKIILNEIKNIKANHILEHIAGCVIGSHCGRGTIGILYTTKTSVITEKEITE